jgi:ABC-2 type transport system ATP-binding protein
MTAALEARGLGRRYGSQWALRDCTLEIPRGSVTALVGPNGAGKTTLLRMAVGLTRPSSGSVHVFGFDPYAEAAEALPRIGFVAQDHPLYAGFTVAEMLRLGHELNPGWDDDAARARVAELGLPLKKRVRSLSGGQRAQVALTLALAKRPELLLLDEPVASLDPLARREFMQSVLEAVAERGLTVVLSSHILADLERVCDRLVILTSGRTQLVGSIEEIVAAHRLLTGPRDEAEEVARMHDVVRASHAERQTTLLVRANGHVYDSRWTVHGLDLEEIVLAYLGQDAARRKNAVSTGAGSTEPAKTAVAGVAGDGTEES